MAATPLSIEFLGTSSGTPTNSRNMSSVAVCPNPKQAVIIDCGESTQHQLLKSRVKLSQISTVCISHMHLDHVGGLPGLLSTMNNVRQNKPLEIFGPKILKPWIESIFEYTETNITYPIVWNAIELEGFKEFNSFSIQYSPMKHRVFSVGYRISQNEFRPSIDSEKLKVFGIQNDFASIKKIINGEKVKLGEKEISILDIVQEHQPSPLSVTYCSDTTFFEKNAKLAENSDVLIHEATFFERDQKLADQYMHSTWNEAIEIAKLAQTRHLILTHFSPRYSQAEIADNLTIARANLIGNLSSINVAEDFRQFRVSPKSPNAIAFS